MSLINNKIIRQGLMKKAPSAKKKDEVRKGAWRERWFVLKKETLFYYKKRGDTRPKGEIDLRAAFVDSADEKTKEKEFTIRIHQASQVFTYIQCSSQQEKNAWLEDIRAAAGYKAETKEEQVHANEYYASFGVLKMGLDGHLRRVVLIPDAKKKLVHVAFEQKFVKRYQCSVIRKVVASRERSKEHGLKNFYQVKFVICQDPRLPNELKEKNFYTPTREEAHSCATVINNFSQGDCAKISDLQTAPPKRRGFLHIQGLSGKSWLRLWAVMVEKRCILYNSVDDTIPVWVVWATAPPKKEGQCGLSYHDPNQPEGSRHVWNFRFEDTQERDLWAKAFEEASKSIEETLLDQIENLDLDKQPTLQQPRRVVKPSTAVTSSKNVPDSASTYVITWGLGRNGQLGNGTNASTPFAQMTRLLGDKKIRCVSAGAAFGCAITKQGQCYTWGSGRNGELGLGEGALKKNYPCLVVSLRSTSITSIACGKAHILALTENGQVFGWGLGDHGQLGHGNESLQYKPKIITFFRDLKNGSHEACVVQVSAAGNHSAALLDEQCGVYTWGDNSKGQLGLGPLAGPTALRPMCVPTFGSGGTGRHDASRACSSVFCGENNTAFITGAGVLFMCGANESGQLGLADTKRRDSPTALDARLFGAGSLGQVRQVALGASHTLAVAGGKLFGWGAAGVNGDSEALTVPGRALADAKFVACSGSHSAFIDSKYQIHAFGSNEFGGLGVHETTDTKGITKVNLADPLVALSVSCGTHFTIALMEGKKPQTLHRVERTNTAEAEAYANRQCQDLLQKLETGGMNKAPAPAAPQPKKDLGVWKEVMDPTSGKPYYYHTVTRQTRWKRPTDGLPIVKKNPKR